MNTLANPRPPAASRTDGDDLANRWSPAHAGVVPGDRPDDAPSSPSQRRWPTPLPPALAGERVAIGGAGPTLAAYVGPGVLGGASPADRRPLILVHSVNAAASAAEVRPLFDAFAGRRPVLALELPGFGSSERSRRLRHTPARMAEAIERAAEWLRERGFEAPPDLLAVSLSCEFAARAVVASPGLFATLAMVSPTGLEARRREAWRGGADKDKRWLRRVMESAAGEVVYRLLTTRLSMRWFLSRTWGSAAIDEALLDYDLITARAPAARHAVAAFVSGRLFTHGVRHLYAKVPVPVWIAHGVRGSFADMGGLADLLPRRRWSAEPFATGAMPYFEATRLFVARYERFLERAQGPGAAPMPGTPRDARVAVGASA
jgi:pimeloyl-ACP methyl ester carboxylesterase